jgi:predicted GTPase
MPTKKEICGLADRAINYLEDAIDQLKNLKKGKVKLNSRRLPDISSIWMTAYYGMQKIRDLEEAFEPAEQDQFVGDKNVRIRRVRNNLLPPAAAAPVKETLTIEQVNDIRQIRHEGGLFEMNALAIRK